MIALSTRVAPTTPRSVPSITTELPRSIVTAIAAAILTAPPALTLPGRMGSARGAGCEGGGGGGEERAAEMEVVEAGARAAAVPARWS